MVDWRKRIYLFVDVPRSSTWALLYHWLMIFSILTSVVVSVISTSRSHLTEDQWREYFRHDQEHLNDLCQREEGENCKELQTVCEQNKDLLSRTERSLKYLDLKSNELSGNETYYKNSEKIANVIEPENENKRLSFFNKDNDSSKRFGFNKSGIEKVKFKKHDHGHYFENNTDHNKLEQNSLPKYQQTVEKGDPDPIERTMKANVISSNKSMKRLVWTTPINHGNQKRNIEACSKNCQELPHIRSPSLWLAIIDSLCIVLFFLDYILCCLAYPSKKQFVLSSTGLIKLIVIVLFILLRVIEEAIPKVKYDPLYEEIFTFVKMGNLVYLGKRSKTFNALVWSIKHSAKDVLNVLTILIVLCSVCALILFSLEPENMRTIPNALYYVIITMTTVGYGDVETTTTAGKVVSVLVALSGLFVLPIVVPIFVYTFGFFYSTMKNDHFMREKAKLKLHEKTKIVALKVKFRVRKNSKGREEAVGDDDLAIPAHEGVSNQSHLGSSRFSRSFVGSSERPMGPVDPRQAQRFSVFDMIDRWLPKITSYETELHESQTGQSATLEVKHPLDNKDS